MNPGDILVSHAADLAHRSEWFGAGDVAFINGYDGAYLVWHADQRGMVVEQIGRNCQSYIIGRHPDQLDSDDRLMMYRVNGGDLVDHVSSVAVLAT